MNSLPDVEPHIFVADLFLIKQQTDQSGMPLDENAFFLKMGLIKAICHQALHKIRYAITLV